MDLWTLDLIVEADEERRLLTPSVRIRGGTPFTTGVVRIELVDTDGRARGSAARALAPADIGTEAALAPIAAPDDAPIEDALRWPWDVTIVADERLRIRWRRYLEVGTTIGFDAEIRLAAPPDDLRSKAEDEGWGPEAMWSERDSARLLTYLVMRGTISEADRKAIGAESVSRGKTVERVLVDRGYTSESAMLERYAEVTGCELLDLDDYPVELDAVEMIPSEVAREYGFVPIAVRGEMLVVAASDPQNEDIIRVIHRADRARRPYLVLAPRAAVLRTLDELAPEDPIEELRALMESAPGG